MAFDIGAVIAHIQADLSGFTAGIQEAKAQADSLGQNISNVADNISNFAQQAAVFVGIEAVAFGGVAKWAVDVASGYEQTRVSLDAMTGSAERGAQAMATMNQFAKDAPLIPIGDVMEAGKQILAFGFSLDKLKPMLKETGEAAIAMNKPIAQVVDVFNFAKEGIFNQRMFGAIGAGRDELEKFGASFTKAGKIVDKAELLPALEKLTEFKFGNIFAKEQNTFAASVQNAKDDLARLAGAFMGVDAATGKVRDGSLFSELEKVANAIYAFLEANMQTIEKIGKNKILQLAIEGFVIALASLVVIIPVVIAVSNSVVFVVFAIQAAIVALYVAWNTNFLGIRDITNAVITYVVNYFNTVLKPQIDGFMIWWKANWPLISAALKITWDIIVDIINAAWPYIQALIRVGLDILTGNWKDAWGQITKIAGMEWKNIQDLLNSAVRFIQGWGGSMVSALVKPFEDAWGKISQLVNKIKDALDFTKRHSPSVIDIVEMGVQKVNDALGGLSIGPGMNIAASFKGVEGNMSSGYGTQITISMEGAIIADSASAGRMGELIGDSIVKKLQTRIRF